MHRIRDVNFIGVHYDYFQKKTKLIFNFGYVFKLNQSV
jgi:hypothetical protein